MTETALPANPFDADGRSDDDDRRLVAAAADGDRAALEAIVRRHQAWIYNLALRMVMVPQDAEDVTQDVLIKVVTKLATYDPERGAFRTWLYRVVTNHVLNMKTRGYESHITGFDSYYAFVDQVPDRDPDESPEMALVAEDLKIGCVMGTLLCLNRSQRLAFILAVGFGATDALGAELLGISKEAFRKTLSRARGKLRQYMTGNCGVVDPEAPCRCRKKAASFIESGAYSVDRLDYLAPNRPRMSEVTATLEDRIGDGVDGRIGALHQDHPFYEGADLIPWLDDVLEPTWAQSRRHLD